jgi:hypothetical protein
MILCGTDWSEPPDLASVVRSLQPMEERERDTQPIDESSYGGSAAETGGLYHQDGPTRQNPEGDTMSERDDEADPAPESHTDG